MYTRLAQQLRGHLRPLVPTKTTTKHAPSIQGHLPQGYSCEVASLTGCALHPCMKYVQSVGAVVSVAATVAQPASSRCSQTSKATPRAIPAVAP